MVKLVDTRDLKSLASNGVPVRFRSRAPPRVFLFLVAKWYNFAALKVYRWAVAHFLFVLRDIHLARRVLADMVDLSALLEKTLSGLGYELVLLERGGRGLMRIYID